MESFITLAQGIVFDTTNEEGRILHADSGECLALDRIATLMVQSGLQHATRDETIADLQIWIEASHQQLEDGLKTVIQQLHSCGLLSTGQQVSLPSSTVSKFRSYEHVLGASHAYDISSHQESISEKNTNWELFLTGKLDNEPLPPFPHSRRMYAMSNTISILFVIGGYRLKAHIFAWLHLHKQARSMQQQEWKSICHSLCALLVSSPDLHRERDIEILERIARRELPWCQLIVRLFAPIAMCLVRSVAFCAYLRAAGLPAQLVVGRECFCLSEDDAFHAWVELAGCIVNDHNELQTGYTIMHRVP